MPVLAIADIEAILDRELPAWRTFASIHALGERDITLHLPFHAALTRAGGTVSGPAMMTLADTAAYLLVLAHAGPVPEAATASLDIHFLARPSPTDLVAVATLLRLGRRLAVCRVEIRSAADPELVAHATVTYALPSR